MALEDITKDVEEETKAEEVEEVSEELGIEDKEDLENLSNRITRLYQMVESIDNSLDELEKDMKINRGAIVAIMQEVGDPQDAEVKRISEQEEEKEQSDNPWLSSKE